MIITYSGPSTIGKDSVWVPLTERYGFEKVIPYTSRNLRPGEKNGQDYNFVTLQQFQEMIKNKELFEWDFFNGNYYGTSIDIVEHAETTNLVFHVLGRMAIRIKRRLKNTKTVMLLPDSVAILNARLKKRAYSSNEIKARQDHYLEELTHASLFDVVVPSADSITNYEADRLIKKIIDE